MPKINRACVTHKFTYANLYFVLYREQFCDLCTKIKSFYFEEIVHLVVMTSLQCAQTEPKNFDLSFREAGKT